MLETEVGQNKKVKQIISKMNNGSVDMRAREARNNDRLVRSHQSKHRLRNHANGEFNSSKPIRFRAPSVSGPNKRIKVTKILTKEDTKNLEASLSCKNNIENQSDRTNIASDTTSIKSHTKTLDFPMTQDNDVENLGGYIKLASNSDTHCQDENAEVIAVGDPTKLTADEQFENLGGNINFINMDF